MEVKLGWKSTTSDPRPEVKGYEIGFLLLNYFVVA